MAGDQDLFKFVIDYHRDRDMEDPTVGMGVAMKAVTTYFKCIPLGVKLPGKRLHSY